MDIHLQVFVTVVEKKNFSKAAEELHMTQPAVSQYIRKLEESVGVRLLERTNKYVRLNKAGEIVFHHAKEITGLYKKMQHLVDDLANEASGPLSIGASYTFGEYILPHLVANMQQNYPNIQPTVTIGNTADISNLVISHQLDVGIVEGHFKTEQPLQTEEIAKDSMVIIASPAHPLSNKDGEVTTKDLEQQTWILRESGSGTREAAEHAFQRLHISPAHIVNFGSTQAIKEAVEAGLGISLLSQLAIQKELRYGHLQIINIDKLPFTRQFSIITTSPFQTKALQVFIDLLRQNKQ
ncbi:LysR family transcriptional regulator [Bacillus sp. Hm123]|uniref:LysR family transcriptional regulator n=1 Tax=Bacillus sp. Hm123 TaxID=3450745 RepID=UPI003F41BEE9